MAQKYDPFTPAMLVDPYPLYDEMRRDAPVYLDEARGRWFLTRYADVDASLRDPRWVAGSERLSNFLKLRTPEMQQEIQPLFHAFSRQMLVADPPDHTRLRGLVSKAFTPRIVERLRPRVERIVTDLLDRVEPAGQFDVIRDFAYPLPAIVIAELLGVPPEEREQFKAWAVDFAGFLGNVHAVPEIDRRAQQSVEAGGRYFASLAARLRDQPRDDLLSAMVLAEEQGDKLSVEELLANAFLLLAAGHETTTNLIGNGLLALLRHPDQLQRLRDDPSLIGSAVEEFLRYEGPVKYLARAAYDDLTIGDQRIRKGQTVVFSLAAADRDPEQFPDPARLDVGRRPNRHLAFGHGIHFCLGAPLARLEGQIAFDLILRRFPDLHLATDVVEWQPNHIFRALKALPVTW